MLPLCHFCEPHCTSVALHAFVFALCLRVVWSQQVLPTREWAQVATMAAPKPVRKEIAPNVILYTTRHEQPTMFVYQLEVTKMKKIVFEIDFQGSENFQCVVAPRGWRLL